MRPNHRVGGISELRTCPLKGWGSKGNVQEGDGRTHDVSQKGFIPTQGDHVGLEEWQTEIREAWEFCQSLAQVEAEVALCMDLQQNAHANRDQMSIQQNLFWVEKEQLQANKFQFECQLKRVPTPTSVVTNYNQYEEFYEVFVDVMQDEIMT